MQHIEFIHDHHYQKYIYIIIFIYLFLKWVYLKRGQWGFTILVYFFILFFLFNMYISLQVQCGAQSGLKCLNISPLSLHQLSALYVSTVHDVCVQTHLYAALDDNNKDLFLSRRPNKKKKKVKMQMTRQEMSVLSTNMSGAFHSYESFLDCGTQCLNLNWCHYYDYYYYYYLD